MTIFIATPFFLELAHQRNVSRATLGGQAGAHFASSAVPPNVTMISCGQRS